MLKPNTSDSWIAEDIALDTAYQLLKATSFTEVYPQKAGANCTGVLVKKWAYPWLVSLEKSDKREKYVWSYGKEDGVNGFRLAGHVWIWMALKAMEHEDEKSRNRTREVVTEFPEGLRGPKSSMGIPSEEDFMRLKKKYDSLIVQRNILRRFTTENNAQKRMMAVARSARETKFAFHPRDTAFYAMDHGFFLQGSSLHNSWNNTIKAQPSQEENQEMWWERSLHYALSIIIGSRNLQYNNMTPGQLTKTAAKTLFRIGSPNGSFPGMLDMITNEPLQDVIHEERDRDFHYRSNFEIHYVLLTYADKINSHFDESSTTSIASSGSSRPHRAQGPDQPQVPTDNHRGRLKNGTANNNHAWKSNRSSRSRT